MAQKENASQAPEAGAEVKVEDLQVKIVELENVNIGLQDQLNAWRESNLKLEAEKLKLSQEVEELKADSETSKAVKKTVEDGKVKIKFLLSPAGRFLLPYNVGQVVLLDENVADEIVESRYAEYV